MKTLDRRYLGTYILHGWYVKFHIPPCTINATKMYIIKIKTINLIFALSLLQSRTKLLEKVFPIMSAFLRNKTISKTTPCGKTSPSPSSMLLPSNAQGLGFLLNTQQHCFQEKGEWEELVQLQC